MIRATGGLDGRLKAPHLEVEEGGGLLGDLDIQPALDAGAKKRVIS